MAAGGGHSAQSGQPTSRAASSHLTQADILQVQLTCNTLEVAIEAEADAAASTQIEALAGFLRNELPAITRKAEKQVRKR